MIRVEPGIFCQVFLPQNSIIMIRALRYDLTDNFGIPNTRARRATVIAVFPIRFIIPLSRESLSGGAGIGVLHPAVSDRLHS